MVATELEDPRSRQGRGADKREVVLVEPELDAAAPARRSLPSAGASAAPVLQHLVAIHDVGDLLVTRATERCRDDGERRLTLRRREVAEAQAVALKDAARKIRPVGALAARELERRLRTLRVAERRQERAGGGKHFGRDAGLCGGLCRR